MSLNFKVFSWMNIRLVCFPGGWLGYKSDGFVSEYKNWICVCFTCSVNNIMCMMNPHLVELEFYRVQKQILTLFNFKCNWTFSSPKDGGKQAKEGWGERTTEDWGGKRGEEGDVPKGLHAAGIRRGKKGAKKGTAEEFVSSRVTSSRATCGSVLATEELISLPSAA